jgi:hypothetical protein
VTVLLSLSIIEASGCSGVTRMWEQSVKLKWTSSGRGRVTRERRTALFTELGCWLIFCGAFWIAAGQRAATFGAFGSTFDPTCAPYPARQRMPSSYHPASRSLRRDDRDMY